MKKGRFLVMAIFLTFLFTITSNGNGFAYTMGAFYNWDASTPNYNASATLHPGTIDLSTLTMGDFVGRNATTPNAIGFGDSGVSVGWDDTWVGSVGNANTNGDALDGLWAQIYSDGGWWDLGVPNNQVVVFSSQDHGPYLDEGLEYRIYGTNTLWDDMSLSPQATVIDVYLDGWRPHNPNEDANGNLWLSDDISGVFQLDGYYQYIKLVAWDVTGSYNEPEIDAIAGANPIPEPSSIILLFFGLMGLTGLKKKFRS